MVWGWRSGLHPLGTPASACCSANAPHTPRRIPPFHRSLTPTRREYRPCGTRGSGCTEQLESKIVGMSHPSDKGRGSGAPEGRQVWGTWRAQTESEGLQSPELELGGQGASGAGARRRLESEGKAAQVREGQLGECRVTASWGPRGLQT